MTMTKKEHREPRGIGPNPNRPIPGFYKMRLVKGGPWVPVVIWRPCPIEPNPETFQGIDRYPRLQCRVAGREADPVETFISCSDKVIPVHEYHYLLDSYGWAIENAPEAPEANPYRAIDLGAMPSLF